MTCQFDELREAYGGAALRLPCRDVILVMQPVDLGERAGLPSGWPRHSFSNAGNFGFPLGRGGQNPVIHGVGRAAPVSDFSAVYHARHEAIGNHHGLFRPGPQQAASRSRPLWQKTMSAVLPCVPTGRQPPGSRKAYMQISIRKLSPLGTGSEKVLAPLAVDAADEGRSTKLP